MGMKSTDPTKTKGLLTWLMGDVTFFKFLTIVLCECSSGGKQKKQNVLAVVLSLGLVIFLKSMYLVKRNVSQVKCSLEM